MPLGFNIEISLRVELCEYILKSYSSYTARRSCTKPFLSACDGPIGHLSDASRESPDRLRRLNRELIRVCLCLRLRIDAHDVLGPRRPHEATTVSEALRKRIERRLERRRRLRAHLVRRGADDGAVGDRQLGGVGGGCRVGCRVRGWGYGGGYGGG